MGSWRRVMDTHTDRGRQRAFSHLQAATPWWSDEVPEETTNSPRRRATGRRGKPPRSGQSSDPRPERQSSTAYRTPRTRPPEWTPLNRNPTICGDSGTTRSSAAGIVAARSVRIARATPSFTNRNVLHLVLQIRLAAADGDEEPRRRRSGPETASRCPRRRSPGPWSNQRDCRRRRARPRGGPAALRTDITDDDALRELLDLNRFAVGVVSSPVVRQGGGSSEGEEP